MISDGLFYCLNAFENFIKTLILLSITVLSHQKNHTEQVNQNTNRQKIFCQILVKFACSVVMHDFTYTTWYKTDGESIARYTLKEIF